MARNERYTATFDESGLALNLVPGNTGEKGRLDAAGGVRFSYRLEAVTLGGETLYRQGERVAVPHIADNAARYERASILEEAYIARDRGVQQTFTLWEALPGIDGDLVIRGLLDTPLEATLLSPQDGVLFYLPNRQGVSSDNRADQTRTQAVLRYSGALVGDAAGRETWADLTLDGNRLILSVPGAWLAQATYPVVIDPMIGAPALVSDPRDMQGELAVAYNGSGDEYLVVWGGYDTGGADVDVIGQRVDADDTLLGSALPIGDTEALQDRPDVAYNPDDDLYLVVWRDRRSYATSSDDVYGQMIAPDGALSGGDIALATASGQQRAPMVAALPGEAGLVAMWNDMRSGYDLYGRRVSTAGAPVGQAELMIDEIGWLDSLSLAAHTGRPEALVAWEQNANIYVQRYSVLVAEFSATPRYGSAPLTVAFADLSAPAAEITTYFWDFGDGETSTAVSPTHTYTQPGAYTVTLTVSGAAGAHTAVKPGYVTVNGSFTPESDLRGYWKLDEPGGTYADLSGRGNTLTATGNVRWVEQGYIGSAVELENDGISYLSIAHEVQNGLDITGSLTLLGWVKPESYHWNYTIMAAKYQHYNYGQHENAGYRFALTDDGKLQLLISPDGTAYNPGYELKGSTVLQTGVWYHVAAVFDAQAREMRLCLNGAPDGSKSVSFKHIHLSTAPFMLGANVDTNGHPTQIFDGVLDEWRVYARALSESQVRELMSIRPPTAEFSATPTSGNAPLEVHFTNLSVNATGYLWNFGDGVTGTLENPTHIYAAAGIYTVTLTAGGAGGSDTEIKANYITVGGQTEAVIDPSGGTLSSADGRVRLGFPPGAVSESITVTMFISETNVYTVGRTAPLVLFSLEAEGRPEIEFAVPVTVTLNLGDLINYRDLMTWEHVYLASQVTVSELPTEALQLPPEQRPPTTFWIEVPLYRSEVTGTYIALIDHFSTWMGGVGGQEYAGWKLTYNAPTEDTFSGAATYNYPLDLPPGRGGLTPAINLSYSSKRIDGILSWTESDWVGRGWSIDAVEIVRQGVEYCWSENTQWICYDNRFTLLINGTGHDLFPAVGVTDYGRYYAKDGPGLYVERRNERGNNASPYNVTGEYWIVRTSDGTTYRLGYTTNSEQVLYLTPNGTDVHWRNAYAGRAVGYSTYRWRVDLVTDTHNNEIVYEYQEYQGDPGLDQWRDVDSRLKSIKYNQYDEQGQSKWASQIDFLPVQEVQGSCRNDGTIFKTCTTLKSVQVKHLGQTLRQYELTYTQPGLLSAIQVKKDEAQLPPTTFTYELLPNKLKGWGNVSRWEQEEFNYHRLKSVANGYGGQTVFRYESDGRAWYDRAGNYRVVEMLTYDGMNTQPAMTTTYTYVAPCYNEMGINHIALPADGEYCPDEEAQRRQLGPGLLVGHALVTVTNRTLDQVVRIEEHRFHTTGNLAFRGRVWQVTVLDPNQVKLQRTVNTWATLDIPSALQKVTTFTYLRQTDSVQYQNSGVPLTTSIAYVYYDNPLYGNVKFVHDYGDIHNTGDDRTTYYEYAINPSTNVWIVSKPAQQQVFAGIVDNPAGQTPLSRTRYYYDGATMLGAQPTQGDLTQVVVGDGPVTVTTRTLYDTYGLPVQVIDARGNVATTVYDTLYHLYPVETCSAVGTAVQQCSQTRYYGVHTAGGLPGQIWQVIDANSAVTSSDYDVFGRLTAVYRPGSAGPSLSYTYYDTQQPFHIWVSADAGDGQTLNSHLFFDGLGRQVQTRHDAVNQVGDAVQAVQSTVYDGRGLAVHTYQPVFEPVTETYQLPKVEYLYTTTAYDALGRTIVVTQTDGTVLRTFYDGRQVMAVDANNHQTVSVYDARGQLVRVQEYTATYPSAALYATTTYQYDILGNLRVVTDTTGLNVITMTYDILGRKIAMSDPDMGQWQYEYDAAGNLIKQTDARGQTLSFVYDPLGRLVEKRGKQGQVDKVLAVYGYDAYDPGAGQYGIGRRTLMTDTAGTVHYVYDARGRLTSSTRRIVGVGDYTLAYTYDPLDRVVSITYPDGEVVTTTYNTGGLANGLHSSLGVDYVSGIAYNQMGQIDLIQFGNGVHTDYVYRPDNFRLDTIRVDKDANDLLRLNYTYDPVGNVLSITDTTNSNQVQTFTYDPLDRLIAAQTNGMGNGQYNEAYTYNEIGNLTAKAGVVYTYPNAGQARPHAVTGLTDGSSYVYDDNGNMIVRMEESITYTQEFNVENRLTVVTATHPSAGTGPVITVTRFIYDGDGTRVAKVTEDGITVYIGEVYEEFIPGLDGWQEQPVVAAPIQVAIASATPPFVQPAMDQDRGNIPSLAKDKGVLLKPLYSTHVGPWRYDFGSDCNSRWDCDALLIHVVEHSSNPKYYLNGTVTWSFPSCNIGGGSGSFNQSLILTWGRKWPGNEPCQILITFNVPGYDPYVLDWTPEAMGEGAFEHMVEILMTYPPDSAGITQVSPNGPQSIGTNVNVTAWAHHRRGVGEIRYYINSATDGSSGGDWHQFATQTCNGAIECTKTAALNWATVPCTIPRDGTHLIVINVLSSSGEWLYWNQSSSRQRTYQWTVSAPVATAEPAYTQGTSNNIGWSAVGGQGCAMYYRVQYANNANFTTPSYSAWTSATNATIGGLADGVRYYYRVQASPSQNANIASAWSNTVDSAQDASVPTPTMQSEPAYTPGTTNTVVWNAVTDGGVGNVRYQAQQAPNNSFATNVITTAWQSGTSYLFSGLSGACQPYYYRVRSQDGLDNTSGWSNIVFSTQDDVPPTGSITINNGAQWTNSRTVTLNLSAGDTCAGVSQMRFNNDGSGWSNWFTFTTPYTWLLTSGSGDRTVQVQFRDGVGNSSVPVSDTITLDQNPPMVNNADFYINNRYGWTNRLTVTLTIAAGDVGSGVSQVCFANVSTGCSAWQAFSGAQTSFTHTLTAGDGLKTVYAWVRDAAGNTTQATAAVTLDTIPPPLTVNTPVTNAVQTGNSLWVEGSSELSATVDIRVSPRGVMAPTTVLNDSTLFGRQLNNALGDGLNIVTITSTDRAYNTTVVTRQVTLDSFGPGLSGIMPTGTVGLARPVIRAGFTEPVSPTLVKVWLNYQPLTTSLVITSGGFVYNPPSALRTGAYTVTVRMYDVAGNQADGEWSFGVDLDTWVSLDVPPLVNVSPLNMAVTGEAGAVVALTVNGAFYAAQTVNANGRATFVGVSLQPDENTLVATITDALNHTATDTARVIFDPSRPQPNAWASPVSFAPTGRLTSTLFMLSAQPPLTATIVAWRLDVLSASGIPVTSTGDSVLTATVVWDGRDDGGTIVAAGAYSYTLTVTASNGLAAATPSQSVWVVDGPPSAPTITAPGNVTTTLSQIQVCGMAEPGSAIVLMDANGYLTDTTTTDQSGYWQIERSLFGGSNILYAVAENAYGVGPQSNRVTVTLVPNPPLYKPAIVLPPTARNGMTVSLSVNARENWPADGKPTAWVTATILPVGAQVNLVKGITYGLTATWQAPWWVGGLNNSDYVVHFRGMDQAGYVGDGESVLRVRNPPSAPQFIHPQVAITISYSNIQVSGWGEPQAVLRLYDNGSLIATQPLTGIGDWSLPLTLSDGTHVITATATDSLGQVSPAATAGMVTVDTRPPTVQMSPPAPFYHVNAVTLSWSGVDPAPGTGVAGYALRHQHEGGTWQTLYANLAATQVTVNLVEGQHRFCMLARDAAGNVGACSTEISTIVDTTPPNADPVSIVASSPYAHASGSTVYYGAGTGSFTVTVTAADTNLTITTSGLDQIAFPTTVSSGASYSQAGAHTATVTHVYTFDADDTAGGAYNVVVTDRATNQTTVPFTVTRDIIAPTVILTLPGRLAASDIPVQWGASDLGSGVQHYDVEYQIANGDWTPWLTATTKTQATFPGTPGVAYTFRVRATDNVSNASAWVQAEAKTVVVKKYYSVAGQRIGMRENGVVYWLHSDHLGNVNLVTLHVLRFTPYVSC